MTEKKQEVKETPKARRVSFTSEEIESRYQEHLKRVEQSRGGK